MKLFFPLVVLLFSQSLMAKSILLSGFDAFNGNKDNNSQVIAKKLEEKFKNTDIKIHYCQLRTVYYKSSEMLKDCYHSLDEKPDYIISLGEGYCGRVSFEKVAFNKMNSTLADNDGVIYKNTKIDESGRSKISLSLNLSSIRKKFSRKDRRFAKMSTKIGSFVCNNLAYLSNSEFDQTPYSFIHVPSHTCKKQSYNKKRAIEILTKTIRALF